MPEWRRETVTYRGAGDERVTAYLYLPRNAAPPFQVVHVVPGGDVWARVRRLHESVEAWYTPVIKSGRAVFAVALRGFLGRDWPGGGEPHAPTSQEFLEDVVAHVTDLRRGVDHLETRNDVDASRIAYLAASAGSLKLIVPAVEGRYRSTVLWGGGVHASQLQWVPEANPILFLPHIAGPKLVVHGRYDEVAPLKTAAEPLFRLLREPKRLALFDGGHAPPHEFFVPTLTQWLDETLGPVAR
jgi:dipeptidyl aminopeptidase/acylaminoacyl peptidase